MSCEITWRENIMMSTRMRQCSMTSIQDPHIDDISDVQNDQGINSVCINLAGNPGRTRMEVIMENDDESEEELDEALADHANRCPVLMTQIDETDDTSELSSDAYPQECSSFKESGVLLEVDEGNEDEGSTASPSVGELSDDSISLIVEPLNLRDEDYDTDLEMDALEEDKWLHPERYDRDTTGLTKYLDACHELKVEPVSYFIKNMQEEELSLKHHGLGPVAMKALCVPLEVNTVIEKMDLEGNWIEAEGTIYLCRALKENVYVTELVLAENKMKNVGAQAVAEFLVDNRTLEYVDLTGNEIGDPVAESLYHVLKKNTTLRRLKLCHNHFEDNGAQWFKEALSENETLESLDLSWNHFQNKGCVALADGLKENFGLKEFNVTMNGFGLEGGKALGDAIKNNRTLLHLKASYCRIPMEASFAIGTGLQINDYLETFDVGYNPLHADGALAMLVGVERNDSSSMKLLDFGKTVVKRTFQDLQEKLESQREIKIIHGGVVEETHQQNRLDIDPMEAFKRDPMTKLKEWVEKAGYRLVDLLRHFDRDQSQTISREEFTEGIQKTKIEITEEQIEILLNRLDTDGDGEIDFSELVQGDNEHRATKREVIRMVEEKEETLKSLKEFESYIQETIEGTT